MNRRSFSRKSLSWTTKLAAPPDLHQRGGDFVVKVGVDVGVVGGGGIFGEGADEGDFVAFEAFGAFDAAAPDFQRQRGSG